MWIFTVWSVYYSQRGWKCLYVWELKTWELISGCGTVFSHVRDPPTRTRYDLVDHNFEEVLISPTSNNNHFVQVASTGTIGLSSLITELHRLCSRSLLQTWFIRLVQSEFRFLRYFTDTWGYTSTRLLQLPRTQVASFSSRTTTYFSQGYRGYVMYILLV